MYVVHTYEHTYIHTWLIHMWHLHIRCNASGESTCGVYTYALHIQHGTYTHDISTHDELKPGKKLPEAAQLEEVFETKHRTLH